MIDILLQLLLFTSKAIIVVVLILVLLVGVLALLSRGRDKLSGQLRIKNLNENYKVIKESLLQEILTKDNLKKFFKAEKKLEKQKKQNPKKVEKNVFVLNFSGDIKATPVISLREEINAILSVATETDEVVLRLESGGGMVHAYGLAAAQLARLRAQNIPLTIAVDKVAASGGYLMASVADKILAAPFAIIGSIGVIVQLPNFHRLLKEKNVDFEQLTAGSFKRTLTLFGHNTEEAREKLQQEIEEIHHLFQNAITEYRPNLDMQKVATGEHWLGTQALELNLVDVIITSDDYLMTKSHEANIYEITYEMRKSLASKLTAAASIFKREDYSSILLK